MRNLLGSPNVNFLLAIEKTQVLVLRDESFKLFGVVKLLAHVIRYRPKLYHVVVDNLELIEIILVLGNSHEPFSLLNFHIEKGDAIHIRDVSGEELIVVALLGFVVCVLLHPIQIAIVLGDNEIVAGSRLALPFPQKFILSSVFWGGNRHLGLVRASGRAKELKPIKLS